MDDHTYPDKAATDVKLIREFQSGNRAAFDQLVIKYKDRLFNLCFWFLGDFQDANDSAQDTFLKVLRSLNKFRFESSFSTWLYRIAVNTCKNKLKSSENIKKSKTVSYNGNPDKTEINASIELKNKSFTPVDELEKKERYELIKTAMNELPPDQKAVIMLRDMEGFTYDEIARITGHRIGTVKSRLSRARWAMRAKLKRML